MFVFASDGGDWQASRYLFIYIYLCNISVHITYTYAYYHNCKSGTGIVRIFMLGVETGQSIRNRISYGLSGPPVFDLNPHKSIHVTCVQYIYIFESDRLQ